jgi:glyoxylate/hydroxypyruvate reductase A
MVGFLGFGKIAKAPALVLKSLGFQVSLWVRIPRHEPNVWIYHGVDQLESHSFARPTSPSACCR